MQDSLYNNPIPKYTELHVLYSIYILLFLLFLESVLSFFSQLIILALNLSYSVYIFSKHDLNI